MSKGQRWRLDEFIVCLDLYLRRGAIGNSDEEVQAIAAKLGRSPGSIALRLANFQFVDPNRTGPGLEGGARDCKPIWDAVGDKAEEVHLLSCFAQSLLLSAK